MFLSMYFIDKKDIATVRSNCVQLILLWQTCTFIAPYGVFNIWTLSLDDTAIVSHDCILS